MARLILIIILFSGIIIPQDHSERVRTYKVGKNGNLEISINYGDIIIDSWNKNEVSVQVKGFYDEDEFPLKIVQTGNNIRIYEKNSASSSDASFLVYVPEQYNIDMKTQSGDLVLKSALNGNLRAQTSGGDIRLAAVQGDVKVNTYGGDIQMSDVTGNATVNTSGGDIKTGNISGKADLTTNGGDVILRSIGSDLKVVTFGGDIKIKESKNSEIVTYGGDIEVKQISGNSSLNTYGGDIVITKGNGSFKVRTSGGDLRLNIEGSVDAQTSSGDISAEITPRNAGKSKLSSSYGEIRLYLPVNVKATVEARIRGHFGKYSDEEYEIRSDFKSQSYHKSNNLLTGKYLVNGGGEIIYLETVNSDIQIIKGDYRDEE